MKTKSIFLSAFIGIIALAFTSSVSAGYGEPGVAPVCGNDKPTAPYLTSITPSGANAAVLNFGVSDHANSWTVAYGWKPGAYIWGLQQFGTGDEKSLKIGHLPPGTYYFVIRGNNGCMPGPFSRELAVTVGGGRSGSVRGAQTSAVVTPRVQSRKVTNKTIAEVIPTVKVSTPVPTVRVVYTGNTAKKTGTAPTPTSIPAKISGFISRLFK